jgi:hypothetical protein
MLTIAAAHGITILLDAVETDGWLATFKANGAEKAAAFGRYLAIATRTFRISSGCVATIFRHGKIQTTTPS